MISLEKLIQREVRKALQEARSTPGNPNVFWLVTSVGEKNEEAMADLMSGELEGVKGISDNNRILMHWLGMGRNAVLVMSAEKVRQVNNSITKVWYDNPDQLTNNNMALLRRIFNADEAPHGNRRIVDNLWRRIYQNLLSNSNSTLSSLGSMMRDGYIPKYEVLSDYTDGKLTIDSPKDLATYFKQGVDEVANQKSSNLWTEILEVDSYTWESIVRQAIVDSVRTYSSEGEWIISGESFRIPEGSRLLVAVHAKPEEFPEAAQEVMKKGEQPKLGIEIPSEVWTPHMRAARDTIVSVYKAGLDKKYDLRFINLNKFKKIQLQLQVKHTYG